MENVTNTCETEIIDIKSLEDFREKMKELGLQCYRCGEDTIAEFSSLGAAKLFLTSAGIAQEAIEYKDAAEFESLVSADVAKCFMLLKQNMDKECVVICPLDEVRECPRVAGHKKDCAWCVLKEVRLTIEAELDKNEMLAQGQQATA